MKKKLNIIAVTGEARHGKDTTTDYILSQFNPLESIKLPLAGYLKLLALHSDRVNSYEELEELKNDKESDFRKVELQDRADRYRVLNKYIFATILLDKIITLSELGYVNFVISDMRTFDEFEYITEILPIVLQKYGYESEIKTLRVKRNIEGTKYNNHISETQVASLPVQYEIQNDGTLDELYEKIDKEFLKS